MRVSFYMTRLWHVTSVPYRYCSLKSIDRINTFSSLYTADYKAMSNINCLENTRGSYEEAVKALNSLQSNVATIEMMKSQPHRIQSNLSETLKYVYRAGMSLDDIDKLSIIHVTGTKGKGSTCAFTERLLRERSFKTGLYTSPHLVSVTERIRINGEPLSHEKFAYYFWQLYDDLNRQKEFAQELPAYFKFLTILAFKVFLCEAVDVAVIEVGIGGEFDCTNIVRNPIVCGITTLDYDHTALLGNKLESIAWHKAGIMKPGSVAVTVPHHDPNVLKIIRQRALEKQCCLYECPLLREYDWGQLPIHLGIAGDVQHCNASLALQLSRVWLTKKSNIYENVSGVMNSCNNNGTGEKEDINMACLPKIPAYRITPQDVTALKLCEWPGRSQVLHVSERLSLYLDGAHTGCSIQGCADWFTGASTLHTSSRHKLDCVVKVLVFNSTGDRNIETLLSGLLPCGFHLAVFTTNLSSRGESRPDQTNYTVSDSSQLRRCYRHLEVWQHLATKTDLSPLHKTHLCNTSSNENILESQDVLAQSICSSNYNEVINDRNMDSSKVFDEISQCGNLCHDYCFNGGSLDETHMLQFTQDYMKYETIEDDDEVMAVTIPYIEDAFKWIACLPNVTTQSAYIKGEFSSDLPPVPSILRNADHIQVLVTGSLHLIGGVLGVLQKPVFSRLSLLKGHTFAGQVQRQYSTCCTCTPGTP